MSMGTIIWDFDGTIADRPATWSGSLLSAFDELLPGHTIKIEDIRTHTTKHFPWHEPHKDYLHLRDPSAWWAHMSEVLLNLVRHFEPNTGRATSIVHLARKNVVNPGEYRIFDDVIPSLDRLSELGWDHVILSNNYPELESVVTGLGLRSRFQQVFTSALIGYEKPRQETFDFVLQSISNRQNCWMIGDNEHADAFGAEDAGIKAILVRKDAKSFHRHAKDLFQATKIIVEDQATIPT